VYVFNQLLHVECVQLAAAFGSQSSLLIEKQGGSKLHARHMSAQISLSPAKHIQLGDGLRGKGSWFDF
jgi:hypothetical protein